MEWIGYAALTLAAVAFGFGLHMSFISEAGAIGSVPVLLWAVASPVMLTLSLINFRSARVEWAQVPIWTIPLGFVVLVFVEGYLIAKVGDLGKLYHQRRMNKSNGSSDSPM